MYSVAFCPGSEYVQPGVPSKVIRFLDYDKSETGVEKQLDHLNERAKALSRASIMKSMATYRSEMKAWYNFVKWSDTGLYLQPPVDLVLAYVAMFANQDSAAKYVSALRWAHHYARLPTASFDTQSLAQALSGGRKLLPSKRPFTYVTWDMAEKLVQRAKAEGEEEQAALYALSANFLPRLRDELLPLRMDDLESHSMVEIVQCGAAGEELPALRISLLSRKNAPGGAQLTRRCLCSGKSSPHVLCPVHSFLQYFHVTGRKRTGRCFSTSYDAFTKVFRRHLATIGVRNPSEYSSKAFRRGTAMELLKQGGRLGDILEAGQWRSPAFLQYMLRADIDELAVFDMIVAQEDKLSKRQ